MAAALRCVLLLSAFGSAVFASPEGLTNPSFEEPGDTPAGWKLETGSYHDRGAGESRVTVDRTVARKGKASLRCSGSATTRVWRMAAQTQPVKAGQRVVLTAAVRSRGVRRESVQYRNSNLFLAFYDAQGKRLAFRTSPLVWGDRDWIDLSVHALAPAGSTRVDAGLFLSMSGTVWFDDVRLAISNTEPLDAKARAAAFDALTRHLERTYPFFGLPGKPDPDKLFTRHRKAIVEGKNFRTAVKAMLRELDDPHIWFQDARGLEAAAKPRFMPANWNQNVIRKRLTSVVAEWKPFLVGRIGDVGYVQVRNFQFKQNDLGLFEAEFAKLETCKSLIFDVRTNTGGDENYALRIAGRFTGKRRHYTNRMVRDPAQPGIEFHEPIKHWFGPLEGHKPDTRPVLVLQGPYCMSSTEGFLQMMRTLPNVTLVGLPSRGASANPQPFELLPGLQLWISTWRNIDLDGNCTEGVGIKPKVTVDVPAAHYADSDPTLDKALALLADDG
ncbi:MAG: S41 family peptidase [Planctomycetota bacterium]